MSLIWQLYFRVVCLSKEITLKGAGKTVIPKIGINEYEEDHHTGDKWFVHGPKHHNDQQLLRMEHSCWLSLFVKLL